MHKVPNSHRWVERGLIEDLKALFLQRGVAWQLYRAGIAEQRRANGLGIIAPFISLVIHVIVLGSVMSLVMGENTHDFMPYFAVSFAVWQALAAMISRFADANDRAVQFLPFPRISGHIVHLIDAYDFVVSLTLRLGAVFLVILVVQPSLLEHAKYAGLFGGLLLTAAAGFAWSLPLAYCFDRLRIVRAFLPQILLMVSLITPIFWSVDRLKDKTWLAHYNPLFHLIEMVREPLLNSTVPQQSILVSLIIIAVGIFFTVITYSSNRSQMVYRWLA